VALRAEAAMPEADFHDEPVAACRRQCPAAWRAFPVQPAPPASQTSHNNTPVLSQSINQ